MKNTIISLIILALVIVGVVLVAILNKNKNPEPEVPLAPLVSTQWRFEDFISKDLEIPSTRIFVDAEYQNGKSLSTSVGEAAGSCNVIDPSADDTDMISGSTKIQCYAAGLGHWFKITQGQDVYNIERKTFEEALPDYEPSVYVYETVATFPLQY